MNAADVLVEELQARGVPFIATLNGHGLDPFYGACQRARMRMIDVRNEQAASYIAEVTGRLTRSVGVCAVSGAVAHANALGGVVNAWFDGAPMLLITGMTPLAQLHWGNFQDMDPVQLAAPVCKYARVVDQPQRAAQLVHEAFTAATTGRPGPVHLALPMDVAETTVEPDQVVRSLVRSGQVRVEGAGQPALIDQAAELIKLAARPLLVAGSGIYYAQGEPALAEFATQQQIPTVVPLWDRGSVPDPIEPYCGIIGAGSGGPRLVPDADLIILAGAEFDYRVAQLQPPGIGAEATVIRIHADGLHLRRGVEAHLSIQGSPATVLEQLAEACRRHGCRPAEAWMGQARRRSQVHRQKCLDAAERLVGPINGGDVVLALEQVLSDETIVLVDAGNVGQWFHQLLAATKYPGHWVSCGASGVVGWGLPGAMAARALFPDRPVILLSGDGAFTFTVAELECAARQNLQLVAVVADDQQWGITVTGQQRRYGHAMYSLLGPMRLDRVAEGFGCCGVRVQEKQQLVPALRAALQRQAPTVIQVDIVPSSPTLD